MKNTKKMVLLLLGAMVMYGANAQDVVRSNPGLQRVIPNSEAGSATGGITYKWMKNGVVDGTLGAGDTCIIQPEDAQGWATMQRLTVSTVCGDEVPSNAYTLVFAGTDAPTPVTIAGVKWATVNMEVSGGWAVRPDQYTGLFQWDTTKSFSPIFPGPGTPISGWKTEITSSVWASSPCPAGWHLPDTAEFGKLVRAGGQIAGGRGGWAVAANSVGNKVPGRFFGTGCGTNGTTTVTATIDVSTGLVSPPTCIFMPAVGIRNPSNGVRGDQDITGRYWSSLQFDASVGHYLWFNLGSGVDPMSKYGKSGALSVRCVQD